jgi:nitrate/TMAO reductase-like tetraheme cytochrome c subunit
MRSLGIAASLIAIVGLFLVEFLYRQRLHRRTYRWLLLIGLFFLPLIALTTTVMTVLEETKAVSSCAACHVMTPFVNDMVNADSNTLAARHYKNRWIPTQQCYSCHTTYGFHGGLAAKQAAIRHWVLYVTGTWTEPIQHRGSYPNANCLACHAGAQRFEERTNHRALATDLAANHVSCISCHGSPHPSPDKRLTLEQY